jgi:hypothetical protein
MNILDSRFKYTPAIATDIRRTFAMNDPDDNWRERMEGAARAMKRLIAEGDPLVCGHKSREKDAA